MVEEKLRAWKVPVGLRTLKTAVAVVLALLVVRVYGSATPASVIFATLGAMSAVGPTFRASVAACLTQICSVLVGAAISLCMSALPIPPMVGVGIGVVILLWLSQCSRPKILPVLPCLVLVNVCLNPEVEAVSYSTQRIWDTAIGLGIGMLINTLVFPYDNSRKIRQTMVGLDSDLIRFLEDLFDGDEHLPEAAQLSRKVNALEGQLALFADQRLFRRKRQKRELQTLRTCEDLAHELLVELETLRNMEGQGCLNRENRQALWSLGASISEETPDELETIENTVLNYHVARALHLRQELKQALKEKA